ncbi:MAG TPA: MqnA/MqnD/SBP family protein [Candidatus Nitrosocosmicus sp.]|nr:MqnA/MqnD/SBP family protein [Candidatus Nitrosocosmicus sp.]
MVDEIRVGHTPDADDAFMFYAIENELIPMNNFRIVHYVEDIEKLNKGAINHELEITAISAHALAYLNEYTILMSGGSFGINYGPIIVSKEKNSLDEISNGIIGIPGYMTSAYLLMTISLGKQKCKEFLFSDIPNAVLNNLVDYGLIIHESQITYKSQKLLKLFDLGEWWNKTSGGLPVPLGINVASNKLMNISRIRDFDELFKNSIQYSLDHPEEAIKFASKYGRGTQKSVLTEFVKMYVNEFTLDMKIEGKNSITKLFGLANEKGIIEKNVPLNYSR